MHHLDRLMDNKLYQNVKINTVKNSKENTKLNLVYFLGNNTDETIQFLGSQFLNNSYFKAIHFPRIVISQKTGLKKFLDQQELFKKVKEKNNLFSISKRNIVDYGGRNLVFSLSEEFEFNKNDISVMGKDRITLFLRSLVQSIKEASQYKSKAIVIKSPDNMTIEDILQFTQVTDPFSLMVNALKRNFIEPDTLKELKDITLVFYTPVKNSFVKFKVSETIETASINRLLAQIKKVVNINNQLEDGNSSAITRPDLDNFNKESVKHEMNVEKAMSLLLKKLKIDIKFASETANKLIDDLRNSIDLALQGKDIKNAKEEDVLNVLSSSVDVKKDLDKVVKLLVNTTGSEEEQKNTLNKLIEKQSNVEFEGTNINDILKNFKTQDIDSKTIDNKTILNEEVKYSKLKDFDNSYMNKQMKQDLVSILASFNNDPDVQLAVTDIKSENTSNELSKKMTYTVKLKDSLNNNHTFTFDYPIIDEGHFMTLNGGKKIIIKQITLLPIVKTKPDTVQITTNYNKFFVTRFGQKLSQTTELLKRFLAKDLRPYIQKSNLKYILGNSSAANSNFKTSLEYNEISSYLLEIETKDVTLVFSQKELKKRLNEDLDSAVKVNSKIKLIQYAEDDWFPIGYNKTKNHLIVVNYQTNKVVELNDKGEVQVDNMYDNISLIIMDMLRNNMDEKGNNIFASMSPAKTLTYSRVKINNKLVPLAVLLGYEIGLIPLLQRYKIQYEIYDKNIRVDTTSGKSKIRFKDGVIVYDSSLIKNTLLLEGLSVIPTKELNIEEMNNKEPYLDAFFNLYGSRNAGKGFHNTLSLMVDPITLDVLKQLDLPTNIIDILLYSNTLLQDLNYKPLNDMTSYRIRGAEQVNAMLYKMFADSFKQYKDTMKSGNPIKMSVPRDALIKTVLTSPTVDEHSTLNPSLEIEKIGAATYKGPSGVNLSSAYTKEIRAFHPSMVGIFGVSTPDSDKAGVVRQLSFDPGIKNTRGFLDTNRKTKNPSTNIYSAAELLNPFTPTMADPPR